MQNPDKILEILSKNTTREDNQWKHKDLYRQLFNIDFFALAYQNIYSNKKSMTKGVNNKTVDGMSIDRVNGIINKLKDESYQPNLVSPVYIPKKNNGRRTLRSPCFDDKLIQECIKLILEAIYDPIFRPSSHGFRARKSCHTALLDIKQNSNGVIWWVEGDIKGFFDNIDHELLICLLKKKISDDRFLRLIRKFLNAGYLEDWKINNTYSGTPQGGIISPILSNIYLHEFDCWVEEYRKGFEKGNSRARHPLSKKLNSKRGNIQAKIARREMWLDKDNYSVEEKSKIRKEIEREKKELVSHDKFVRDLKLPALDPMDNGFKRIVYTRYADDWVTGIIGSKQDAVVFKYAANKFFEDYLKLELSSEKTLITNGKDGFNFLGYHIRKSKGDFYKTTTDGYKVRTMANKYQLLMPTRKEFEFIANNGYGYFINGEWKPKALTKLFNNDDLEIMEYYNASFRGIYNYYRLADNVSNLQTARFLWQMSWAKTMANKYRSSKAKMFEKYRIGNRIGVTYTTKRGQKIAFLYDQPLRKYAEPLNITVDDKNDNFYQKLFVRTSLMDRLKARECEICGVTDVPLSMHHVKRIKELRKRTHLSDSEKFMAARNRKQIALCEHCHNHAHETERKKDK